MIDQSVLEYNSSSFKGLSSQKPDKQTSLARNYVKEGLVAHVPRTKQGKVRCCLAEGNYVSAI